jgi:hypothetical protein
MAKAPGLRLLEVQLFALDPDRWEWRVFHGDTPIKVGYAPSRETAQIEADSALSRLLSEANHDLPHQPALHGPFLTLGSPLVSPGFADFR